MRVYELIHALLLMPAGAEVRAMNCDDKEALALLVDDCECIEPLGPGTVCVAALHCVPAPPKDA